MKLWTRLLIKKNIFHQVMINAYINGMSLLSNGYLKVVKKSPTAIEIVSCVVLLFTKKEIGLGLESIKCIVRGYLYTELVRYLTNYVDSFSNIAYNRIITTTG